MDVELAEERILVLADRFNLDHAEGRAWAKRTDAFGTVAKLGGLLNRAGSDDYECVYRERRLQPFWRLHSRTVAAYERTWESVGAEVSSRRGCRGRKPIRPRNPASPDRCGSRCQACDRAPQARGVDRLVSGADRIATVLPRTLPR